jgi:hypothetical protein
MSVLATRPDPRQVAKDLDTQGFVCLEKAISPAWLDRARAYVHDLVETKGERYFALNWPSREAGSPAAEVTADAGIRSLLEALVQLGRPGAGLDDEIYNVLRIVTGDSSGEKKSLIYHYDNTVITALVPILIPEGEPRRAGELLAFPNHRGYRSTALFNIAEKAVVQSDWYRQRFTNKLPDGELPEIRLLEPGNLYLFWGYRTYHANFPVSPGMLRATMLLHHGDPHPNSLALKALKARNLRRERRNLETSQAG